MFCLFNHILDSFTLATLARCGNICPFRSFALHKDVLAAIPIINNCLGLKISAKSFTCDSPPGSAASSQEEPDSTDAVLLADSVTEAMLDISGTEV